MTDVAPPSKQESIHEGPTSRLFASIGARPVINAAGAYTVLGGSQLSPAVQDAMNAANSRFADMDALLRESGLAVAEMLGAEAAYITAGAAASLVLASAACLTRNQPGYLERLPDTRGIPNQIVVQRSTRQKYDRCLTIAGAAIAEAGDEAGMTIRQLRQGIGPDTVAVHYLAPGDSGTPRIEDVVDAAHEAHLPVIVDAAGQTFPVDNLRRYARAGADLVCYAGKYFDAPQSTGLLLGRKDLIDLAAINGFTGFETSGSLTIGRAMKVDRQEVFGCVMALREWLSMDHERRLATYGERCDVLLRELRDLPGIQAFRVSERETPPPQLRDGVRVLLPRGVTPEDVAGRLREGDPCIWVRTAANCIDASVAFISDDDTPILAAHLRHALTAAVSTADSERING